MAKDKVVIPAKLVPAGSKPGAGIEGRRSWERGMTDESQRYLTVSYAVASFIGASLIFSVLIYAVVVELIKKQYAPFSGYAPMPDIIDYLRYTLLTIAVAQFFLIRFINDMFSAKKSMKPSQTALIARKILRHARLIIGAVIVFALCEMVAIYGLILFLIEGKSFDFYIFMIISLGYYAVFFPRYSHWRSWTEERNIIHG